MVKKKKEKKSNILGKEDKIKEKQLKLAIILMVVVVAAFLISYFGAKYIIASMNEFNYAGMKFQKAEIGYVANFPIKDIFGNTINYFKIKVWEDPRKLDRINVTSNIALTQGTGVDLETLFSEECEDGTQAGQTILIYLNGVGIKPLQVTTNKELSNSLNITYVDCKNAGFTTVILKKGNESIIKKQDNCYVLETGNNCEIMNVTERFMVAYSAQSRGISI